jgi:hypothetical protein
MTFDKRQTEQAASRAKLRAVVDLGVSTGVWSVHGTTAHLNDEHSYSWADVVTPDGLTFSLSAGSWSMESKIRASVACLRSDCGISVTPRDVLGYGVAAPEASVSASKTPEQIIKDITRRVLTNPDCVSAATKMRERMASLLESKSSLSAHMATLSTMGFTFNSNKPANTYVVDAWHKLISGVKVYENGRVSFDCSVNIADLPAVLALLKKGE